VSGLNFNPKPQKEQTMYERFFQLFRSCFPPTSRTARTKQRPIKTRPLLAVETLETRLTPTVTPSGSSADFHVDITEGETVSIGRTDNFKLRVTADGFDLPV
jgi:hypothetical protein